jgi:hypothetical protein
VRVTGFTISLSFLLYLLSCMLIAELPGAGASSDDDTILPPQRPTTTRQLVSLAQDYCFLPRELKLTVDAGPGLFSAQQRHAKLNSHFNAEQENEIIKNGQVAVESLGPPLRSSRGIAPPASIVSMDRQSSSSAQAPASYRSH